MATWLIVFIMALAAADQDMAPDRMRKLGEEAQKEGADIKQPIEEIAMYIGSSQCENAKKLMGVSYEQLKASNRPDTSLLTLEFYGSEPFNLSTAAKTITESAAYKPGIKLVIYAHGFSETPQRSHFNMISEGFQKLLGADGVMVLGLDSSSLIKSRYLRASTHVHFVGNKLGEMLAELVQQYSVDESTIHLIGQSLGAHISGFAGRAFTQRTRRRLARISGSDPAGPCFVNSEARLKKTDAQFVDVLHSNAGAYGLNDVVGHADFFPNGGSTQPDCLTPAWCSHNKAVRYFGESLLSPRGFPAKKCRSWDAFRKGDCEEVENYMGYAADAASQGMFFLQTAANSPFSLGPNGTNYSSNNEGFVRRMEYTAKDIMQNARTIAVGARNLLARVYR